MKINRESPAGKGILSYIEKEGKGLNPFPSIKAREKPKSDNNYAGRFWRTFESSASGK